MRGFGKDLLLLLRAAPTWLWGPCGRRTSPPASSVIDFIFCRSDGSHVPVDTVHPSLFRSSSLSSPGWYHLQSWSPLFTWPNHLSRAFLHRSVILSTFSLSLKFSFLTWSLSVWLHAHLHILISVTSSLFTWYLVNLSCGGTLLSHRTPDIFLLLFRPH